MAKMRRLDENEDEEEEQDEVHTRSRLGQVR